MDTNLLAPLVGGAGLLVSVATFLVGRRGGTQAEIKRQQDANTTAEQTAKRLIGEATREAEALRKSAVLTGKEEALKQREHWEKEARGRREEDEREERRVLDKESALDRKFEILEQRDKDLGRRGSELGRREKTDGFGAAA